MDVGGGKTILQIVAAFSCKETITKPECGKYNELFARNKGPSQGRFVPQLNHHLDILQKSPNCGMGQNFNLSALLTFVTEFSN